MAHTNNNVDPHEIHKFNQIADRWWDPQGEFKPLHEINPLRLAYIHTHINLAGGTVLDVGCGGGILAESMAQAGATVTGIDMGENALQVAKLHLKESKLSVDYQLCTAETMATTHPGHFDVVTCMEMLEHVPDPVSIVTACAQLCKPGGQVFFSTLNRNSKAFLYAIVGAEYVLNLLPKGTHHYAQFIKPSELCHWARMTGLSLQSMQGMAYQPLTRQYHLSLDVSVNYLIHFSRDPN